MSPKSCTPRGKPRKDARAAKPAESPDVKTKSDKVQGADFESTLPLSHDQGADVSVENIMGDVKISEIDGENVVVRAHKSAAAKPA